MSLVPGPRNAIDPGMDAAGRRELGRQGQRVQAHRAARVVAGHSADARECAELLAMLGLVAGDDEAVD
jgi:hypothetical protein